MKQLLLGLLLFTSLITRAQWPTFNQIHPVSCQWPPYIYYANGAFTNIFVIDTLPDYYDGYITLGKGVLCSPSSTVNPLRVFSCKINIEGDLMNWMRYDSLDFDLSQAWSNIPSYWHGGMCQNHNGDIITTLTTYNNLNYLTDDVNYLLSINILGEVKSQHVIDSTLSANYTFTSVIEDMSDSTYVLTGYYSGIGNPQGSGTLVKVDSLGSVQWQTYFVSSSGSMLSHKSLDGGYYTLVQTLILNECANSNFANNDIMLIKTNEVGVELGRFTFGGACSYESGDVFEISSNQVLLVGRSTNESTSESFPFDGYLFSTIIEVDEFGQLVEISEPKKYLNSLEGHFVDLHKTQSGNYLIVCDNQLLPSQGSGLQTRWLGGILALNQERDSVWFRSYSYFNNFPTGMGARPAYHYLLDSKPTNDGGYVLCGYIKQMSGEPNNGLETPWIFKVDSMGCLEPGCQYVGVEEIVIGLENTINAFPNPAHDKVNLAFTFPENFIPNNQNEIVIIDMQGKEVLRQPIALFASTTNTIDVNISSLSSGLYTVHWLSNKAWLDSTKIVVE